MIWKEHASSKTTFVATSLLSSDKWLSWIYYRRYIHESRVHTSVDAHLRAEGHGDVEGELLVFGRTGAASH